MTLLVCAPRLDDPRIARWADAASRQQARVVVVTTPDDVPADVGGAGVVAVGADAALLAADVAEGRGIAWHPPAAVRLTRDRLRLLGRLTAAGVPVPRFAAIDAASGDGIDRLAGVPTPWRVSSTLDGRRGVAGDLAALRDLVSGWTGDVVVEPVIDGPEWWLMGLIEGGALRVVGLIECRETRAHPGTGRHLESPAPMPRDAQAHLAGLVLRACAAVGLSQGPAVGVCRRVDGHLCLLDLQAGSLDATLSDVLALVNPSLEPVPLEALVARHALGAAIDGYAHAGQTREVCVPDDQPCSGT